ncbi:hypothetical protein H6F88_24095 [Oculatella sp. FACHB-28]|uniref:hypothetical protein n=1 Tax=Cyanophyceae TaxID=3028117 RepID=UPI001689CC06|nr:MULTISPECIES: hypothetical protein [Cyanophyceae]MBD1999181.1 hypothetical protein [Leptolyngbya sp. FACHB-541]MBD2059041.1 hypothetical protein [Oculatella sp. FACHB-28]
MDKFLRGFIAVEKTTQIVALAGVILFLGYLGLTSIQHDQMPSIPDVPTTQQ